MLNGIKLFMERKDINIEELNDEGLITSLAFLMDVTAHLDNLHKELIGKDRLITDMHDNIKAFEVKLQLWEKQLKLHNLVHFPYLKFPDTVFAQSIHKYSQSFSFALRRV
jgi:hypothetical protein